MAARIFPSFALFASLQTKLQIIHVQHCASAVNAFSLLLDVTGVVSFGTFICRSRRYRGRIGAIERFGYSTSWRYTLIRYYRAGSTACRQSSNACSVDFSAICLRRIRRHARWPADLRPPSAAAESGNRSLPVSSVLQIIRLIRAHQGERPVSRLLLTTAAQLGA